VERVLRAGRPLDDPNVYFTLRGGFGPVDSLADDSSDPRRGLIFRTGRLSWQAGAGPKPVGQRSTFDLNQFELSAGIPVRDVEA
jgi:hypothetical protein